MNTMNTSKKILITGGAGYIGSHTVVALFEAGFSPVILDNLSNSNESVLRALKEITGRAIPFYKGDCTDKNLLSRIIENEGQFLGIIHFAAFKSVSESVKKPLVYYKNNIDSLLSILSFAEDAHIPHVIFSSSCTVYGEPDILPVTELTPIKTATSPYGYTKQVCERIIHDWVVAHPENHKALSLRYFNPVGAHPSGKIGERPKGVPENLLPYLTQVANGERKELTIYGNDYNTPDGTCIRDYIHVVDLAHAHVASLSWLIQATETSYDVFNVGIGKGVSVLELITTFEAVTGIKLPYVIGPRRPGDIEKVYADNTKITSTTGWKPMLTITDALRDSWHWQTTGAKNSE